MDTEEPPPEIPRGSSAEPADLDEQDAEPTTHHTDDDLPFDQDIACIRCGYNLRGLKPDGLCPECGARIRKSLNFALERILCLACMRPVHPSVVKCPHCGAPMNSAASGANYWQITARGVARRDHEPKSKPRKPFPWPTIAWFICTPPAGYLILVGVVNAPRFFVASLVFVLVGALLLVPAIVVSCIHKRRLAAYFKQVEAEQEATADRMSADGTTARKPRRLPTPPPSPIIAWLFCTPLALLFVVVSIRALPEIVMTIIFVAVAILLLIPALRASHQYNSRRRTYQKQIEAIKRELAAATVPSDTENPSDPQPPTDPTPSN